MPSPQSILSCLVVGAIGSAGILRGLYEKSTRAPANRSELEAKLHRANEEIESLRRENESLRSLAQGGGNVSVPEEFITRTEKDFGLKFLSNPIIHRISSDKLRERITASIESRFGPSGIVDRQLAYVLIGWLKPNEDLLSQLAIAHSTDVSAWFDPVTGEGWMLDETNLKNIPDQASLIGLLAKILLHQHFPISPDYPGDDADRGIAALHQGAAAGAETRFLTEQARTMGFMPMKDNRTEKQILNSLSPFIRSLSEFPTTHGKGFVDSLHLKGNEALHTAFRSPPQTTEAILQPTVPAHPPSVLEPPDTQEEPYLTDTAGQLGLQLWLKSFSDAKTAQELSDLWKNDRYYLFSDGENASTIHWDIELDSPASVDRLESLASTLVGKNTDHRISILRITPTRLRFSNTASLSDTPEIGQ